MQEMPVAGALSGRQVLLFLNREVPMTTAVTTEHGQLSDLAVKANEEHARCRATAGSAIEHARECGLLLIQAKSLCPHGKWQQWLADNFRGSRRSAQVYVRVAKRWSEITDKGAGSALFGIDQALRLSAFMGRASLGASVLIEPHADPNLFFVAVYGPETDSEGNGLVRYARRAVGRDFVYLQLQILDARLDYDSIEWEQLPWEPRSGVHRLREWPSSEMV